MNDKLNEEVNSVLGTGIKPLSIKDNSKFLQTQQAFPSIKQSPQQVMTSTGMGGGGLKLKEKIEKYKVKTENLMKTMTSFQTVSSVPYQYSEVPRLSILNILNDKEQVNTLNKA